jgi:hypothetical protein
LVLTAERHGWRMPNYSGIAQRIASGRVPIAGEGALLEQRDQEKFSYKASQLLEIASRHTSRCAVPECAMSLCSVFVTKTKKLNSRA